MLKQWASVKSQTGLDKGRCDGWVRAHPTQQVLYSVQVRIFQKLSEEGQPVNQQHGVAHLGRSHRRATVAQNVDYDHEVHQSHSASHLAVH